MSPLVLALVVGGALTLMAFRQSGVTPVMVTLGLVSACIAAVLVAPFHFDPIDVTTALIVSIGLIGLAIPALFLPRAERSTTVPLGPRPDTRDTNRRHCSQLRFGMVAAFVLVLALIGWYAFRVSIQSATDADFGDLTLTEIRRAQNGDARGGGGLFSLLGSTAPLLACLGIYGGFRHSRRWWVLTLVALWIVLQNPSRLNSISVIVISATFAIYGRRSWAGSGSAGSSLVGRRPPASRARLVIIVALAAAGALAVFLIVGAQLGKNDSSAASFPDFDWPAWTLSPLLYFTGGFPALTEAVRSGSNPFEPGNSFFTILRLASIVDHDIVVPDTIAEYVGIPAAFNLYTGFGQVYFDAGLVGTFFAFAFLGAASTIAHRRAVRGDAKWIWACAALASVLLSVPQSYIFFHLDFVYQLALGFTVFSLLEGKGRATSLRHPTLRQSNTRSDRALN